MTYCHMYDTKVYMVALTQAKIQINKQSGTLPDLLRTVEVSRIINRETIRAEQ